MRVFFINNDGGGFANHVEIDPDVSVEKFFNQRMARCRAEDFIIRVNRLPVASDQVLKDGDRVTITPTKVEGA